MDGIVHKDGILSQSKDRASGKANEKSASQSCSSQIMSHHNNQQEYFQKDSRQDTTIVQVHGKNVNQDDHGVQMNVKKSSTECIKEEKKKGRLRKKAVLRAVLNQMEFYFSDCNLSKDRYLRQLYDKSEDGYIDLAVFGNFNKLQSLHKDGVNLKCLHKALEKSTLLEVDASGTKVKRRTPFKELDQEETDRRTIYVEFLPRHATHAWVENIFSQCGKVCYVSLPTFKTSKEIKGFAFVEFQSPEDAQKACEMLNNPPIAKLDEKPGRFPKGNKTLNRLQKIVPAKKEEENEENLNENEKEDQVELASGNKKKKKKKAKKRRASESGSEESMDKKDENLEVKKKKKKKKKRKPSISDSQLSLDQDDSTKDDVAISEDRLREKKKDKSMVDYSELVEKITDKKPDITINKKIEEKKLVDKIRDENPDIAINKKIEGKKVNRLESVEKMDKESKASIKNNVKKEDIEKEDKKNGKWKMETIESNSEKDDMSGKKKKKKAKKRKLDEEPSSNLKSGSSTEEKNTVIPNNLETNVIYKEKVIGPYFPSDKPLSDRKRRKLERQADIRRKKKIAQQLDHVPSSEKIAGEDQCLSPTISAVNLKRKHECDKSEVTEEVVPLKIMKRSVDGSQGSSSCSELSEKCPEDSSKTAFMSPCPVGRKRKFKSISVDGSEQEEPPVVRRKSDGSELMSCLVKSKKPVVQKKVEFNPVPITKEFVTLKEVRRRKKVKRDGLHLRVITKKKWLSLKAEFITQQKSHMSALKESLRQLRQQENPSLVSDDLKGKKHVDLTDVFGTKRLKPSLDMKLAHLEKLKFLPNVIVQWKCAHELPRKKIKELFNEISADCIDYIEAEEQAKNGYIRFKDAESAEKFAKLSRLNPTINARVLPESQQAAYWEKANRDRIAKLSRKRKERGTERIAKKVFQRNIATFHQKPSSHIVFDEDVEDAEKIDKVNEEIEKKKEENGESETKEYISAAVEITTKD